MVISNSLLLIEVIKRAERWRRIEINIPKAAELDVRGPVIEVEGVEIFDKDGTELVVVEEVDRFVIEVDFYGTNAETDEPHEDGEPPGASGTIAFLTTAPRLVLVGKFLGQHGRRHGGLGFFHNTKLRRGGIGSNTSTVDGLYGG